MRSWCCAVVLVVLVTGVKGMVWDRDQDRGQFRPLEINVEEALQQAKEEQAKEEQAWSSSFQAEEQRLLRRQTAPASDIGYTQRLPGDNHRHGLVHWTGYPSEALFILTRSEVTGQVSESWLWRSTDYGHTFSNDTVKWRSDTVIQWYYIAPLSEYLIFADVLHQVLWVTQNEGETYSHYSVPFSPDDFVFQSRRAPGANSTTLAKYVLGYDNSNNSLWVSWDLGAHWRQLGGNVTNYSWRILNSSLEHETAVYFEQAVNDTHSQLFISTYPYNSSEVFDRTLSPFLANTFVLSNEYMFVQMSGEAGSQDVYSSPLWVSRYRHPFRQARFPLRTQEKHYAVVDTSEGQVFIAVFHDLNSTHLYLSEELGLNYSLSLNYIISPPESSWISSYPAFDVHVVEGIVGTYVANVKDPSGRFGSTVISYDKGGEWVPLRPPQFDRFNRFINCQQPDCSLHLHIQRSRSNGFQSILTQDSAIGLVMALGNLGSSLTTTSSQLRLYFSRDGGFTWFEVGSGYWQFQFAAQGAVVASIPIRRFTSSVQWSCDEGHNWDRVSFLGSNSTITSIYVIGMLTEFGERALHVTVFGITARFTEWLVTDLNFTSVLPNVCTQEDFFSWIPTDERPNGRCVLGESITYERRNASVDDCCYPDPSYNRPVSRTPCPCAQEDFECDFGFQRVTLNSPCTPIPGFLWPPPQPHPCPEGDTYNISSGYRLVALDKCIPGEERTFFPKVRPCLVGIPQDFTFTTNITNISPNETVAFTLTQHQGAKLYTNYTWNFGVGDSEVFSSGYEESRYQVFAFPTPGLYTVSLHASSLEGDVDAPQYMVTVLDPLGAVFIVPPIQIVGRELPAGLELLFHVNGTTQSGVSLTESELTGTLRVSWNYGDGTPSSNRRDFSDTHRFTQAGSYTVVCVVSSPLGGVSYSMPVTVYEASTHVRISGDYYVVVDTPIQLTVLNEDGSGHIIPPMTIFSWTVTSLSDPPCHSPYKRTTSEKSYNLTLPCWGEYAVSVIGNHSLGFFTNNRHIMAEEMLTRLEFEKKIPAVVRNGVYLTVSLRFFSHDRAYEGPVVLNVLAASNHSQPTSDDSDLYELDVQLSRANLSNPQTVVTFVASNDVSNIQHKVNVTIAVSGNYEALRFLFPTTSFPADHAQEWLDGLVDTLLQQLKTKYLSGLPSASLEVEDTGFVLSGLSTSAPVVRSVSKSVQSQSIPQELFYVDINLLPESLKDDDIRAIHQASVQIQQDVEANELVVQYSGTSFPVTVEKRGSATVIVQPPNTTLYIALGAGLGAGLLLLLVIAIVLGAIVYMYRRQYKSLNVRYSRLRQTPVRFTFTQEGEMVEEDDYEEPSDEDMRGGRQTDSDDDAEMRMRSM